MVNKPLGSSSVGVRVMAKLLSNILFITFYSSLLCGGIYLLAFQGACVMGLLQGTCYYGGIIALASGFMIMFGGFLLWNDFVTFYRHIKGKK